MATIKSVLIVVCCIISTKSHPLWFNPHAFELDNFEIKRGYFQALNSKQDCIDYNDGHCIYSNFINSPNILYIPDELNSFKSSFHLSSDEAIVISGFAPPLAQYFTITPYVSNIYHNKIYASISNHSLHLHSTWFVAIISSNLQTIHLIHDWFKHTNTSLTTSIYNHYIYDIPIVQNNRALNIDENTEYSVIIRHETTKRDEDDLKLIYSQAPALLAWHIKALLFNEVQSVAVTELNQIRQQATTNEYDIDLFVPKHKSKKQKSDKTWITKFTIDQDSFHTHNYDSSQCLSSLNNCNFDTPNSILFTSPVFKLPRNAKIIVSGINHINTNNARYSTINIVNDIDTSVIAQIRLNDIENDSYQYIIMFAADCSDYNKKWRKEEIMFCEEIHITKVHRNTDLIITEFSSTSNNYGIDIAYIQAPYVVIEYCSKVGKYKSMNKFHASSAEFHNNPHNMKPNIMVIILDDLGWKDVGFNGAEYTTMHIDELATTGLILNNWYVHPVCTPTRTALYTGRYAFRYNMSIPLDVGQRRYLPNDEDTLQEVLSSNGYTTHLVGKWHVGNSHWRTLPNERGFDSFFGFTNGFADYYSHQQCWKYWSGTPYPRISGDNNLRLLNAFFPEGLCVYDFFDDKQLIYNHHYFPYLLSNRAVRIINSKRDESDPFYMLFSMGTPHTPIVDPPQHFAACDIPLTIYGDGRYNYCNMMQIADGIIGDIVGALKQNDLWSNTVMIVTSDNGGIANRDPGNIIYGSYGSNMPLRGLKSSPFEGGNRVIGFINGGYMQQYNLNGEINHKLYHVVDLYETIINGIARIGIDFSEEHLDSLNIWDSIINAAVASPRDEWIWTINFGDTQTAIRMREWKLVKGAAVALSINDGYWDVNNVTIAWGQNEETEYLFHIKYDEEEYFDVKDEESNIVEYLKERLQEIEEEGFTPSSDAFEIEGFVVAMLNGVALPYLDLTQEIKIET